LRIFAGNSNPAGFGRSNPARFASRIRSSFPLWCGHVSEHLMSSRLPFSRSILIAGALVLGLSACGRRGALEAPPDASAARTGQETASEGSGQATLPSPVGTPRSKPNRSYTIPNKPFILDPIL